MSNIPSVTSKRLFGASSAEINEPDLAIIAGSFEVADDANATNVRGQGFQINQGNAEGQFIITFASLYPMLVSCVVSAEDTDAANDDVTVTTETYDASAGTMVVKISKESTGTLTPDDTNTAGMRINFVAVFHRFNALSVSHTA